MCSVDENDFCNKETNQKLQIAEELQPNEVCKKCQTEMASIKIGFKDALCSKCFVASVRHKFRAALGATRIVARGSNAVLVFDGSPESCLLLDVVHNAIGLDSYKRLHLIPCVLYVDDSCFGSNSNEERIDCLKAIQLILDKYNFKSYYTSLDDPSGNVEELHLILNEISTEKRENISPILRTFQSLTSSSSQIDFIKTMRNSTIIKATTKLNSKYAFVADIGSDLAKTFLTNIVLGKGSSVGQDISFADPRSDDVTVIRPLRDLLPKEVDHYNRINELMSVSIPSQIMKQSIQSITESFIDELQNNFTGSVSTIFKTGNKIHTSSTMDGIEAKCLLCRSKLSEKDTTTLTSIEYSRYLSMNAGLIDVNRKDIEGFLKDHLLDLNLSILCHGCYNIFRESETNVDQLKELM